MRRGDGLRDPRLTVGERFSGLHMYDGHAGRAAQGACSGDRRRLTRRCFRSTTSCWRSTPRSARPARSSRPGRPRASLEHRARRPRGDGPPPRAAGTIVLGTARSFDECPAGSNRPRSSEPLRVEPDGGRLHARRRRESAGGGRGRPPSARLLGRRTTPLRKASEEHPSGMRRDRQGDVLSPSCRSTFAPP